MKFWTLTLAASVGILASAGCARTQIAPNIGAELTLATAGFRFRPADTPEKVLHLESMPQRKLVRHVRDGQAVYLYADAAGCDCLYVGDQAAFQKFQRLAVEHRVAAEQREATEADHASAMDWDVWGPLPQF